jgi:hypothetical protein
MVSVGTPCREVGKILLFHIMPSTVSGLFSKVGLSIAGQVIWGETVPENGPGVYIVAISSNPSIEPERLYEPAPISNTAIKYWIRKVPRIELDGRKPSVSALAARLKRFWLPDESVLYIGKTDKPLRSRVGDFYRTPLGDRRPHAGGHWLKTLSIIDNLTIFWALTHKAEEKEKRMLKLFMQQVSELTRKNLCDPFLPLLFANIELDKSQRKRHGIKGPTLPK